MIMKNGIKFEIKYRYIPFLSCVLFLCTFQVKAQPGAWQLFETDHPVDVQLVAVHIDQAAGTTVDKTGQSDVTPAVQQAIDDMFYAGGGTIYFPEGRYRFDGSITVRESVKLRGDFTLPGSGAVTGTVFEPRGGRNDAAAQPFITVRGSASVNGLTIWYPEQDAASIVPYPATILFQRNDDNRYPKHCTTARFIHLVNSYFGIDIGKINTALPMAGNIFGSPLSKGIRINECSDVSRIFDIHFSPDYWSDSGLPGAPAAGGPHAAFMLEQGHAVDYIRSDNGFNGFWYISGYATGMTLNSNYSAGPFYNFEITGCGKALVLQSINQVPACFTHSIFEGSEAALVQEDMTGAAQFNTSVFRSDKMAVKPAVAGSFSASQVSFQDCIFEAPVHLSGLMANVANSDFTFDGTHVTLDQTMRNVILMDNRYQGGRSVLNNMSNGEALIRDTSKVYTPTPDFEYKPYIPHGTGRSALYIATDFAGVNEGDDMDDGPGLQMVLDQAAADGGGIVFLPAGEYVLNSAITIPSNVELRGVLDMPHHGKLPLNRDLEHEFGSFFYVDHGNGTDEGATINISANAGVRGVTFYYPEQDFYKDGVARPFPWLFGLQGENIYVQNICAVNPYQLMDIASVKCDNHYVENIYSMPLLCGIQAGGGSEGGRLRNVHYNGTMLLQAFYPGNREQLDTWSYPNTEAFRFGTTLDQEMLFCFGRLCRAGIVLHGEDGPGPNGVSIGFGIEDIKQGACLDVTANNGFTFINASLLSESGTVFMNTTDTLELFNSRTKQSAYFVKSGDQLGKLVFNQVLHRGDDTRIQYHAGEVEIINGLFFDGLQFVLDQPSPPLTLYGVYLRNGALQLNFEQDRILWDYLEDNFSASASMYMNADLFLYPGTISSDLSEHSPWEGAATRLYPNPVSDFLIIRWPTEQTKTIRIFDATGRMVYHAVKRGTEARVEVGSIGPPGIYYVVVPDAGGNEAMPLVVR